MNILLYVFILFWLSSIDSIDSISCLDEAGNPVDSWTSIKAYNSDKYYTFNEEMATWELSKFTVSQTADGCIMQTMNQLYGQNSIFSQPYPVMAGIYNDEPTTGQSVSSSYAHAKGILVSSETNGGFWLLHSMPNWPNTIGNTTPGVFPSLTYAQSLICISLDSYNSNQVAGNLMIDHPFIYSSVNSPELASVMPLMSDWLNSVKSSSTSNASMFESLDGKKFNQFAKSGSWGKDLWDDLVAPHYEAEMNVETWRNGEGGRMSSICGQNGSKSNEEYSVYEVASISMPDGISWSGTEDHSKWGATLSTSSSLVSCVGDINRMCSQESRGGGAICSDNLNLWKAFDSIIKSQESCYQYNPCYPYQTSTQCYWCPTNSPSVSPQESIKFNKLINFN
jgi:deoxyribonuclease-2